MTTNHIFLSPMNILLYHMLASTNIFHTLNIQVRRSTYISDVVLSEVFHSHPHNYSRVPVHILNGEPIQHSSHTYDADQGMRDYGSVFIFHNFSIYVYKSIYLT
jgi:hypothetical protein